jgi:hypothetical protein
MLTRPCLRLAHIGKSHCAWLAPPDGCRPAYRHAVRGRHGGDRQQPGPERSRPGVSSLQCRQQQRCAREPLAPTCRSFRRPLGRPHPFLGKARCQRLVVAIRGFEPERRLQRLPLCPPHRRAYAPRLSWRPPRLCRRLLRFGCDHLNRTWFRPSLPAPDQGVAETDRRRGKHALPCHTCPKELALSGRGLNSEKPDLPEAMQIHAGHPPGQSDCLLRPPVPFRRKPFRSAWQGCHAAHYRRRNRGNALRAGRIEPG